VDDLDAMQMSGPRRCAPLCHVPARCRYLGAGERLPYLV